MDAPAILITLATVMAVGFVGAMLAHGGHAENGCGHGDLHHTSTSERFYFVADRPAGPDAEDAAFERDPPLPRTAGPWQRWLVRRRAHRRVRAGG